MPLAVPSEMTAVVGAILTAAGWNSNVRDAINYLLNPPLFRGTQGAGQSCTSGVWTPLAIDTSVADTYTGHSNTVNNSRYTPPVAGWYRVVGRAGFGNNVTNARQVEIRVNGVEDISYAVRAQASAGTVATTIEVGDLVFLNGSGDYVEIWVNQNSGGALSTQAGTSSFTVKWDHA